MTKPYHYPGIYLEELPLGVHPIQGVGTSTAGFIGVASDQGASVGLAVAVNSWGEYRKRFVPDDAEGTPLGQAVYGFFLNGGQRCFVVNTGGTVPLAGGAQRGALDALAEVDEIAIVAAPGLSDPASYDALRTHCELLGDRVAILDAPPSVDDMAQLTTQATAAGEDDDGKDDGKDGKPAAVEGHAGKPDAAPPATAAPPAPPAVRGGPPPALGAPRSDRGFAAVYFPHLWVRDPFGGKRIAVAPSGHMAGVWARTDATRGVHKAPANETVRGALDLTYRLTDQEQGVLNDGGINAIRYFSTDGIKVWGARTLADPSSEWRYLNVRRLVNMIEESIVTSTRWIVFEPNDQSLWKAIRRDITAFLTRLWRDGALFGRTPEESFFVRCDEETNPPEIRDAGQVVTLIGLAPVKPAEFIIFRISQFQGGSETETVGA